MSSASPPAELPKQYDHQSAQQQWGQVWRERGYFHSQPSDGGEPFTIVIPPPNVTGALHLGHALNNTLQDILIRYKRMQGYNVLWMPGTDHAGIATQAVVEKRLREEEGLTRHDLGREELVQRIWKWKDQYEQRILGQLQQMGCSCDWERTRFTLDPICARAVRQTFFSLFQQSLIYRGKKLVNWDTFLQTAVSDDEVFHTPVQGHFWHFRYPVIDPAAGEPEFVEIATTRPETMLGDTAVAVHPDPAAALDKVAQEYQAKLSAAPEKDRPAIEAQLADLEARRQSLLPRLEQLRDMAQAGRQVRLPLLERPIQLIADTWAKPELGSGCVKITPAHDPNDYEVGLRRDLEMINILNRDGTLNDNAGPYSGLSIEEARRRVVADLDQRGLLGDVEDREIDLAHSDRSKTPIEPYLADQWFVKMADLAQSAMDAVTNDQVRIVPARYAKGYLDWLSEKRDWPIGRQLWWGHRIPVWTRVVQRADAATALIDLPHLDSVDVSQLDARLGAGLQEILSVHLVEGPSNDQLTLYTCVAPGHEEWEQRLEAAGLQQEEDVLDTWFSSALWPHSTLGWPEQTPELDFYYPTSVLITSRDIITLWVARMVLMGLHNLQQVPFHEVYIHPKILDRYGETMSKSKGNGVDPLDVVDKFGADSLRFGIAYMTTETQDVRMPVDFECPHCGALIEQTKKNRTLGRIECNKCQGAFSTQWATSDEDLALPRAAVTTEQFELGRNFCNKLWNASRFALMNLSGYQPLPVSDDALTVEDRWLLSRLATVTGEVTTGLSQYRYADVARALYSFAWDEFCSFYIEMVKPRLDEPSTRPIAQRVLASALDQLLRLLHPVIPFVTEEVWHRLGEVAPQRGLKQLEQPAESVIVADWPAADEADQDPSIERQFALFQAVLKAIREMRNHQNIPPREAVDFCVRCDAATAELLRPMEPYFQSLARASATDWGANVTEPPTCASRNVSGIDVFVDMAGFIDVAAEIAKAEKELQRLNKQIAGREAKLSNENYLTKAPAAVVQQTRDDQAAAQAELATLQATLEKLRQQ